MTIRGSLVAAGYRRVEAEQLRDGDADGREGQACPEPREECPL